MDDGTLPGTEPAGPERIVCHVDVDCFYASCERLRERELRGEPVVVGMGYEPGSERGAVATASYEARDHGVESAQPISGALEALPRVADAPDGGDDVPRGHYRPVDMAFYESVAADVKAILRECADVVREVSVDEAYLDVTERTAWTEANGRTLAEGYARHVKQRVAREVGLPASVGVAPTMSAAKVASDHDKPDGLVVVPPGEVRSFLAPLSVEELHGVGPVTARRLRERGVETAGDLAAADAGELAAAFGERGRELHARARGVDDREVTPTGRPKSLSREAALGPTDDVERARETVRALAADVAERARSRGATYRTIGVKVVRPPFDVNTRATSLPGPVDDPDLVESTALSLLAEFEGEVVRKLGVRVSKLSFEDGEQASLDSFEGDGTPDDGAGDRSARSDGRPAGEWGGATLDEWADRGSRDGQVDLDDFP